ncbi:MAG: lycopene cyclase domain-containing protein [Candidatus Nanohaloarchaea archaeon]
MEYLLILLTLLLSALFIEHRYDVHLYDSRKERIAVTAVFFAVGVLWDTYAIMRGHWKFGDSGLIGIKIGVMPLEEYLFILIVPFWIMTTYKLLDSKFDW